MESQQGNLFALPLAKRPRPSSHAGCECEQVSEKKVHCALNGKQIFNVKESDGTNVAGGIAKDANRLREESQRKDRKSKRRRLATSFAAPRAVPTPPLPLHLKPRGCPRSEAPYFWSTEEAHKRIEASTIASKSNAKLVLIAHERIANEVQSATYVVHVLHIAERASLGERATRLANMDLAQIRLLHISRNRIPGTCAYDVSTYTLCTTCITPRHDDPERSGTSCPRPSAPGAGSVNCKNEELKSLLSVQDVTGSSDLTATPANGTINRPAVSGLNEQIERLERILGPDNPYLPWWRKHAGASPARISKLRETLDDFVTNRRFVRDPSRWLVSTFKNKCRVFD
jgi:hypothetical protein